MKGAATEKLTAVREPLLSREHPAERRFFALGQTDFDHVLFLAFIVPDGLLRVISANEQA